MLNYRPQSRIWIGFAGFFMAALLVLLPLSAFAQSTLPVPALTARVMDQTATLTADEVLALSNQLQKLEAERGAQVVVLMVASTQPEDIFSYSNRVANAWKIGRKGVGDGVLIVVAKNDRKLRVEIAKSLEGAIPDVLAGQIISESITPQFKQGQYASGLQAGVALIAGRIGGEALPAPKEKKIKLTEYGDEAQTLIYVFGFIFLFILIKRLTNGLSAFHQGYRGSGGSYRDLAETLVTVGRITGHISNSGGSSFSAGGGGNFGGGGASGDW
jgi:uncharacterized protein